MAARIRRGWQRIAVALAAVAPATMFPISGAVALDGMARVGDVIELRHPVTDEACKIRMVRAQQTAEKIDEYAVKCDGWEREAGRIRSFSPSGDLTADGFITDGRRVRQLEDGKQCEAPQAKAMAVGTAVVRRCVDMEYGYPYTLAAVRSGDRLYAMWGVPHVAVLFDRLVEAETTGVPLGKAIAGGRKSEVLEEARQRLTDDNGVIRLADLQAVEDGYKLAYELNIAQQNYAAREVEFKIAEAQRRLGGELNPALLRTFSDISIRSGELRDRATRDLFAAKAQKVAEIVRHGWTYAEYLYESAGFRAGYDPARTLANLKQAADVARAEAGERSGARSWALMYLGLEQIRLKAYSDAITSLEAANRIAYSRRGRAHYDTGVSALWLSWALLGDGKPDEALERANEAHEILSSLYGPTRNEARALTAIAQIQIGRGENGQAIQAYRRAVEVSLSDRNTRSALRTSGSALGSGGTLISGAEAGSTATGSIAPLLGLLAEMDGTMPGGGEGPADYAFRVSQLPEANPAGEAVTRMAARLASADPALRRAVRELDDAKRAREDAQMALGKERLAPENRRNAEREARLVGVLEAAERKVAALDQALQTRFPQYGGLVSARPLAAAAVGRLLKPGEALLRIVPTDLGTFLYLVTPDGWVRAHRSAATDKQVTAAVRGLRDGLDWRRMVRPFDTRLAHRLYQDLIGPFDGEMAPVKHLILVPDGALLSLPPALLVRAAPKKPDDYKAAAWLARDMATSVLPSVEALADLRATVSASRAKKPFLGIGAPKLTGKPGGAGGSALAAACLGDGAVPAALIAALPALPETADELKAMAGTLKAGKGATLTGSTATAERLRKLRLSDYRVLAFATHGVLPGELKCKNEPGLVLSPVKTGAAADDGLLTAGEIAGLALDADLAVLSACNTAGPDGELGGEALSGLVRAFVFAGTRAVLASHWSVPSKETAALTTGMVQRLYGRGTRPDRAEALRAAQLAIAGDARTAHPFYWAAFTVIGDGGV